MNHDAITDADLDTWATSDSEGKRNSVDYLRPLTPEQRALAYWEAKARMGISGFRFSGAIWQAVQDVKQGLTPALDANAALIAHDPTGHKAATHAERGGSWASFRTSTGH